MLLIAGSFVFAGCASVVNERHNIPLKVETKTAVWGFAGRCRLQIDHDYGVFQVKSCDLRQVQFAPG